MRTLLLVVTVLVLFALAVGGVSAHDGNHNDNQMNETMDRCLAMMDHMGEMMGSGSMADEDQSESMTTETGSSPQVVTRSHFERTKVPTP
jgi:hypothetical protein